MRTSPRHFPVVDARTLGQTGTPPQHHLRPGGRKLGYDLRGEPGGRPVYWFHGSPSGRLEAVLLDAWAREHGLCIVATDRPGLGASDPHPGWTMESFAEDVTSLASALGHDRFAVAGGSGGGPFVLALAAFAGPRIDRAVSLACAGAFDLEGLERLGWVDRVAAWAVRRQRWLVDLYFGALNAFARAPEPLARGAGAMFAPGGQGQLAVLLLRTVRESLMRGTGPLIEDTEVLHRPWAVPLDRIAIHVDLVNGTRDEFIPFAYGETLLRHIPKATLHVAEGDDHFRTIFDLDRLSRLLDARPRPPGESSAIVDS